MWITPWKTRECKPASLVRRGFRPAWPAFDQWEKSFNFKHLKKSRTTTAAVVADNDRCGQAVQNLKTECAVSRRFTSSRKSLTRRQFPRLSTNAVDNSVDKQRGWLGKACQQPLTDPLASP
jgi:hypothetical protein